MIRRPGLYAFNAASCGGNLAWALAMALDCRPWWQVVISLGTASVSFWVVYKERRRAMAENESEKVKTEFEALADYIASRPELAASPQKAIPTIQVALASLYQSAGWTFEQYITASVAVWNMLAPDDQQVRRIALELPDDDEPKHPLN